MDAQFAALRDFGIPDKDIYVEGRNGEGIEALLMSLRGGRDELYIAADLRVFGAGRNEILGVIFQLEDKRVPVHDLAHPEDKDRLSLMLKRALGEVAKYARWRGSKKDARRVGAKGGKAKGASQESKRAEIARPDVIERACGMEKLTWADCEYIFGIPAGTLRRRYGPKK